jgi:hypothetical protein
VPKVISGTAPEGIGLDAGRFNITVRETGLDRAAPAPKGAGPASSRSGPRSEQK